MGSRSRDPDSFDHMVGIYDRFSELTSGWISDYLDHAVPASGQRAIDLGCGTGVHTELLAGRYQEVVGVDISGPMLALATRSRQRPTVRYELGDLLTMDEDLDGTFDLVFSAFVLHHVHPLEEGLRRARALVRPGGHAILIDVADDQPRSRRWFQRQAVGSAISDLWHHRRPARETIELLRLSLNPAWLDHLVADRPLPPAEFCRRYGDVLPGAEFARLGRLIAVHWRRPGL